MSNGNAAAIGTTVITAGDPRRPPPLAQRALERTLFATRWLLAPFYVGLAIGLAALLVKFVQEVVEVLVHAPTEGVTELMLGLLSMIDLSLMAGLLLMMILAGYESFVSRLDAADNPERLEWMGRIGFAELKLKLIASIAAISAIRLLESFMNTDHVSDRDLAWQGGILLIFVVSGLLLALMDRVAGH